MSTMDTPNSERPIVVKLGGAADVRHDLALDDLAALRGSGRPIVLVHGGSGETNALAERVGHAAPELVSPSGHRSRHTDPATRDLFVMATALVNRRIVGALHRRGVRAFGLSGLDGATLLGRRKTAIRAVVDGKVRVVRDDWSGKIEATDTSSIEALLATGLVPVVAPVAMTAEGEPLNVDGDRAAAELAAALGAETLVLLTGANGLYRHFPDEDSRIESATLAEYDVLAEAAQGRMKRKVLAAREALTGGALRVAIAAADRPSPITSAIAGHGTTIHAGAPVTT